MKKNLVQASLAMAIILIAVPHSAAGQTKTGSASQNARAVEELKQADRAWMVAPRAQANVPARERILADEFTHVFSDGRIYDRAYHLNTGGNQDPAYLTLELVDETVRVYGDAAVTSGRVLVRNQNRGGEVVSQSRYTNTYTRRHGRWQIVASQWTRVPPQERAAINVDPAVLDAYVGQYELAPNLVVTITREGNRLMSEARGRKSELTPETETRFLIPAANLRITFVRNADGQVTHIVVNDNGQEGQARRVRQ